MKWKKAVGLGEFEINLPLQSKSLYPLKHSFLIKYFKEIDDNFNPLQYLFCSVASIYYSSAKYTLFSIKDKFEIKIDWNEEGKLWN